MPHIRIVHDFADLPAACHTVFSLDETHTPFLCLEWFELLASTGLSLKEGRKLHLLLLLDRDAAPLALLPAYTEPIGRTGQLGLYSLSSHYSVLYAPLIDRRRIDLARACQAFARHLRRDTHISELRLAPLSGEVATLLSSCMQHWPMRADRYHVTHNWHQIVGAHDFAGYWAQRPATLRHTVERKARALMRAQRLTLRIVRGQEYGPAALADYLAVYAASWKDAESHPYFIQALLDWCARSGMLRLGLAYIDGQPAAAQFWITHAGVASIYKLAYHPQFRNHSIGSILTRHMMHDALDQDHVHLIDFLTGDDPYKADWMNQVALRQGVIAFRLPDRIGLPRAAHHFGGRLLRRMQGRTCSSALPLPPEPK